MASKTRQRLERKMAQDRMNVSDVFGVVEAGNRKKVVDMFHKENISLGMTDPVTGRSLMYNVLTRVTNGDKIVMERLDDCVVANMEDVDDEDYAVTVQHKYLVDEDTRSVNVIKDLLILVHRKNIRKILHHPTFSTFIQRRWDRTKWTFFISFFLYLFFVVLFSTFLIMIYNRTTEIEKFKVKIPEKCKIFDLVSPVRTKKGDLKNSIRFGVDDSRIVFGVDDSEIGTRSGFGESQSANSKSSLVFPDQAEDKDFDVELQIVKKRKNGTRRSRVSKHQGLFSGCSARKRRNKDYSMCTVEIFLVFSIALLLFHEAWQLLALGKQYFKELENWFELLIIAFAIATVILKKDLDSFKVVAAIGICITWIELIFLFGRFPFLGGMFSIMFYSITKRIIKTVLGFIILIIGFTGAFFIINFGQESEHFDLGNPFKAFMKVFVMVLGEFEFDDLYEASSSDTGSFVFTMILLILLITFGSIIMINLIVAIIISDIGWLQDMAKDQALLNQAQHAVQINSFKNLIRPLTNRICDNEAKGSVDMALEFCVHSCCSCSRRKAPRNVRETMEYILKNRGHREIKF